MSQDQLRQTIVDLTPHFRTRDGRERVARNFDGEIHGTLMPHVNDVCGRAEHATFPFEQWRYRYIEDIGQEVIIEFVDTCMCGDYHMTMDRSEKDASSLYTKRRLDHVRAAGYGEQG